MKYSYTAYYYYDEKIDACRVEIPALDLEYEIPTEGKTDADIMKAVRDELGLTLYLYEREGVDLPADVFGRVSEDYTYTGLIEVDTSEVGIRGIEVLEL